ncbi:MAG: UDP-2,3-diacylglucosamine diphosphatase [Planctomycetota bacterium]
MARLVFVSDLHLGPAPAPRTAHFLELLAHLVGEQRAGRAQHLVCAGDLFSFWVERRAVVRIYREVLDALAALTAAGCGLTLLEGNRDFGFGRVLAGASGAELPGERVVLEQNGTKILVFHGDQLLTADRRYQFFKRVIRSFPARAAARLLPSPLLLRVVGRLERVSESEKARKEPSVMRVDDALAAAEMAAAGAAVLIHGHTHVSGTRRIERDGESSEVFSLGQWDADGGDVVFWPEGEAPRLLHWPEGS